jgi:Uma2 family endonuclease
MSAEKILPAETLYTVEEFFRLIPDGDKGDLIDGRIYMSSPDSIANNDLGNFLFVLFQGFSRRRKLGGKVQSSRVAFVLGERRAPEPDVAYISQARLHILTPTRALGAPDIAVEIVSEDSVHRDYVLKRDLYEQAGVREYWIVDPLQQRCTFLRLHEGRFEEVPLDDSIFHSDALPGFWLDTRWLFSDPLPDEFECLEQILGDGS